MSRRAARSRRHLVRDAVFAAVVAVVVTAAPTWVGAKVASPIVPLVPPLPDALADVDTAMLWVARAPFCDRVRAVDVEAAVGGAALQAPTTGAVDADYDEYDCTWAVSAGAEPAAEAWIYAPPVSIDEAKGWLATPPTGCTAATRAAAFGSVSAAYTCPSTDSGNDAVMYRGLFGDAFVNCRVVSTSSTDEAFDTAGRFCLAVVRAAAPQS